MTILEFKMGEIWFLSQIEVKTKRNFLTKCSLPFANTDVIKSWI